MNTPETPQTDYLDGETKTMLEDIETQVVFEDAMMRELTGLEVEQEGGLYEGSISVLARLEAAKEAGDDGFEDRLKQAYEDVHSYFAVADRKAPTRCIDGRPVEGFDPDVPEKLGAQVPGGTVMGSLAYRIAKLIRADDVEGSLIDDVDAVTDALQDAGLGIGGHSADHAAPGRTGCGAIDKMVEILRSTTRFESVREFESLVKHLMGDSFDAQTMTTVIGAHSRLQAHKHDYLVKDPETGEYTFHQKSLDELDSQSRDDDTTVECLAGDHNEVGLIINLVPGTTFDRNKFAHEHDNEFQMFNYDLWRTIEVANVLFPEDQEAQDAFVYSRVLLAVSTAMVLTDGSLKLGVHSEK